MELTNGLNKRVVEIYRGGISLGDANSLPYGKWFCEGQSVC